jgi:hypothetical protein
MVAQTNTALNGGSSMIVLDAVLVAGIATAIVGFMTWAIFTQYRDAGCAHLRIERRRQRKLRLVTLDQPQAAPGSTVAL